MAREHLTRRTFAAGTSRTLPFMHHSSATFAHTPGATAASRPCSGLNFADNILALTPEERLSQLESEPFSAPWASLRGEFPIQPFDDLDENTFSEGAVGGVRIVHGDGEGDSNE